MEHKDVRPGMKVVPHDKSVAYNPDRTGLNASNVWFRARQIGQPYLYVSAWNPTEQVWLLNDYETTEEKQTGDFFIAADFEPYVENSDANQ